MAKKLEIPKQYLKPIDEDLKHISSFLKQRRESLELTQSEVASSMGVEITTLQYLENGSKNPKLKTLLLLMKILEVELKLKGKS